MGGIAAADPRRPTRGGGILVIIIKAAEGVLIVLLCGRGRGFWGIASPLFVREEKELVVTYVA